MEIEDVLKKLKRKKDLNSAVLNASTSLEKEFLKVGFSTSLDKSGRARRVRKPRYSSSNLDVTSL